jgi:hypothetical protein
MISYASVSLGFVAYTKVSQCQLGIFCFTLEQDVLGFQICQISISLTSSEEGGTDLGGQYPDRADT